MELPANSGCPAGSPSSSRTLAALTLAFFGVLPRLATLTWSALVLCLFFGEFGAVFEFKQRLLDISPFTHIPRLPGGSVTATPLILLTVIAAALALVGMAGLRRRDLPTG